MSKKDKTEQTHVEQDQELQDKKTSQAQSKEETVDNAPDEGNEVSKLKEELEQEKERCLRLFAEFENYKKRTSRERLELFKTAGEGIMTALLPVLDDFERALSVLEKTEEKEHFKGVKLIFDKLNSTLKTKGLEVIEVKVGDAFDVETQEAITQVPAPEDKLKGKVLDVVERGYKIGDKIIRYPKVVIGK